MKTSSKKTLRHCQDNNIKLTELRQAILLILTESVQPMSAYDILANLQKSHNNANAMTVYRVLEFLISNGLAHRIESLNAFSICSHLNVEHQSQWLICSECRQTKEYINTNLNNILNHIYTDTGFLITQQTIELKGLCSKCITDKANENPI